MTVQTQESENKTVIRRLTDYGFDISYNDSNDVPFVNEQFVKVQSPELFHRVAFDAHGHFFFRIVHFINENEGTVFTVGSFNPCT
jgi:hypothetical protein